MDKIIDIFRPYLDTIPGLDYVKTKLGWVYIHDAPWELQAAILRTENELVESITAVFLDTVEVDDMLSRDIARITRTLMEPYLDQLSPRLVQVADDTLEVFARVDDDLIPRP